jgi:outer membrane protein OmpA-like peptidoglycan-associated protein
VLRRVVTLALASMAIGCAHAAPHRTAAVHDTTSGDDDATRVAAAPQSEGESSPCGDAQVFFAPGAATLDHGAELRLDTFAGCLARREIDVVYVTGMTDRVGTPEENLVLGHARAAAVAEYLRAAGVDVAFVVRSVGEEGALDTEPLWPLDRNADARTSPAP